MDISKVIEKVKYGNVEIPLKTLNLQEKVVSPTTSAQEITPDEEYGGLSSVNINPVTSEIDSNIQADNIKKDVTILGVTGTLEGGGDSGGQYLVQVIDYDGTVLKSDHLNEGDTFELPNAPTHERLVFDGWSSPVTITNNGVVVDCDITIGAMYHTTSGNIEIDIVLPEEFLSKTMRLNTIAGQTIDWGDGMTTIGDGSQVSHEYADYGNYTIMLSGIGVANITSNFWLRYITKVALPNSVTSIAENAFFRSSLTSIVIPNSVTSIGKNAFKDSNLTSIVIPNSVTSLGESAFSLCISLSNLALPNSVTSIGKNAFSNCLSLTSIVIPNSVTSLGESAFSSCKNVTNVTLKNRVLSISAFSGCSRLTSIVIPNSITSISQSAFENCHRLTNITILNSNATIGAYSFRYCYGLAVFNNHVKAKSQSTFWECNDLYAVKGVDFNDCSYALNFFYSCGSLTELEIYNIKIALQIGSGTSYGHLLTVDSLLHTIKELHDNTSSTSSLTLTVGSANLEKLANVYVKLIEITDDMRAADSYIDKKKPFEVCESTDEGAMLITDYARTLKNWLLA